jgi:hypothetical protein
MTSDLPDGSPDSFEMRGLTASEVEALSQAKLSTKSASRREAQDRKRSQYFFRGPLSFETIKQVIPDPASRVVLVALAFMDMERADRCTLSQKVWKCAGVENSDQHRRVLARLRKMAPALKIIDRPGRTSVLVLA